MNMKRVLLVLLLLILLLITSCGRPTNEKLLYEMQKTINNFNNYSCTSNIVVKSNKGETKYVLVETFVKPDKIKLEIVEPKDSFGCIIIYDGAKMFLKHPSINQTITLENIKSIDKQYFLGDFFKNLSLCENPQIKREKIGVDDYIIFNIDMPAQNQYRWSQSVWINERDFTPYKMNILDMEGIVNTEVIYEDFDYDIILD